MNFFTESDVRALNEPAEAVTAAPRERDQPPAPSVRLPEPSVQTPALMEPDAYLLAYLQTHDAACPQCQYNLRGASALRCPECGREIRMEIGLAEPVVMPWVLTTVFVAMAASAGILFVASLVFVGPRIGKSLIKTGNLPILAGAFYGMCAVPLTAILLRGRRKFMQRGLAVQWTLAVASFLVNAGIVAYALVTHWYW